VEESYTFREFAPRDLPRLHEIREAAFEPVFKSFRQIVGTEIAERALSHAEQEQADLLKRICKKGSSDDLIVVEEGGDIIAFCALTLDGDTKVGEIGLNAVHPDFQGRGIGTAMYTHALECMRKAGMRAASVGTGGDASHMPARRAYEKAGFGPTLPTLWMYRML